MFKTVTMTIRLPVFIIFVTVVGISAFVVLAAVRITIAFGSIGELHTGVVQVSGTFSGRGDASAADYGGVFANSTTSSVRVVVVSSVDSRVGASAGGAVVD